MRWVRQAAAAVTTMLIVIVEDMAEPRVACWFDYILAEDLRRRRRPRRLCLCLYLLKLYY